ncbi:MAG: hypothetical protein KC619_35840 [Myxococcales bacterium]|nr:hypothetical protein [Myxococcales bacterium]
MSSYRPRLYVISGLVLQLDPYFLRLLGDAGRRDASLAMAEARDLEAEVDVLQRALDGPVVGGRRVAPTPRVYTLGEREVVRVSAADVSRPEVFAVDGGSVLVLDAIFLQDVVRWFGRDSLPERVALATETRCGVEVHGPALTTLNGRVGTPFAGDGEHMLTEAALRPGPAKARGFREALHRDAWRIDWDDG